jgi:hypothetical protein
VEQRARQEERTLGSRILDALITLWVLAWALGYVALKLGWFGIEIDDNPGIACGRAFGYAIAIFYRDVEYSRLNQMPDTVMWGHCLWRGPEQ